MVDRRPCTTFGRSEAATRCDPHHRDGRVDAGLYCSCDGYYDPKLTHRGEHLGMPPIAGRLAVIDRCPSGTLWMVPCLRESWTGNSDGQLVRLRHRTIWRTTRLFICDLGVEQRTAAKRGTEVDEPEMADLDGGTCLVRVGWRAELWRNDHGPAVFFHLELPQGSAATRGCTDQ